MRNVEIAFGKELSRWTPGLSVVDQGSRSNVVIVRGLHTDALNGSEAAGNNYNNGVATYLGDIPLAVDLRLHDIERVEVLLGSQGTLYGAGTLAGAVRYLPRRPDTQRRTLEVRGDLFALAHGGAPGSDAGLTFNLPVVEHKLALRGSVDRYADPGFIEYDYLLRTPGVSEPEPDLSDPEAAAANLCSFGIAGLLPGTFPALARAQALDPDISVLDLTSRFRSFSAYTREDSHEERLNWETRLVSTGDGPWRWVGGVFFNRYDSHGTSFEYAPGLSAFSGVTPILSGRPVSEPVEYHSLGVQAVEERPTRPCSATTSRSTCSTATATSATCSLGSGCARPDARPDWAHGGRLPGTALLNGRRPACPRRERRGARSRSRSSPRGRQTRRGGPLPPPALTGPWTVGSGRSTAV